MPSATYLLFAEAMQNFKQILCVYDGHARELCPVILGHTDGEEAALTYQFGGSASKKGLPPGGQWKCLRLAKVSEGYAGIIPLGAEAPNLARVSRFCA